MKIIIQHVVLLYFRLPVGRAGQITQQRTLAAADTAAAVPAAGCSGIRLHQFKFVRVISPKKFGSSMS